MFPVLFEIPLGTDVRFPIRMFGILVILGFLAGTWLVSRRLKRAKAMEPQEAFDFCFYLLAIGILGARVLFVAENWGQFEGKGLDVFKIWEGGLIWYGGFALATFFAFWWLWTRKLPVLPVLDALALGTALSLAIGRWGSFCAGDDYGKVIAEGTESPAWYAVQFPNPSDGWRFKYTDMPESFQKPAWLHPVQIYMSIANFVVLGVLFGVGRLLKRPGVIAAAYLMLYPIARAVTEMWRGYEKNAQDVTGTGPAFSQSLGIPVFLVGALLLRYALTRTPDGGEAA